MRVLKPGGYLLAFSGTRTYHRMAVAIEDAGFEVRDMIEWVYGSGFPKSLNIGKAVDKLQGNEREVVGEKILGGIKRARPDNAVGFSNPYTSGQTIGIDTKGNSEWEGWGTALKPAHEPICMARKPLAEKTVAENVLRYGTGGINIDESRVGTEEKLQGSSSGRPDIRGGNFKEHKGANPDELGFYEQNILGRFPANLIHDNSEEVRECFPNVHGAGNKNKSNITAGKSMFGIGDKGVRNPKIEGDNGGNASRFFKSIIYQAKASKSERNKGCEDMEGEVRFASESGSGKMMPTKLDKPHKIKGNAHPTVKPIALMEYLIKMVTPKG